MKLAKRLTSNYKRDPTSNIGKLLSIVDMEIDELKKAIETIELYRKIDNATGVTLDNIGKNVLQERGSMDDVTYRLYLKVKVRANLSGGQIETLNDVLSVLLGDNFLTVREVWNNPTYGNEPAAVEVRYINFFQDIRDQYKGLIDDRIFFDGRLKFGGSRKFDGGYKFIYSDAEQKILDAMNETKKMMSFIKAGGVAVHWCEPITILTGTITTVGAAKITSLGTFPTITQIGFGTGGHNSVTGDPKVVDIALTSVPGEVVKKSVEAFSKSGTVAQTFGILEQPEGNGETISAYGLYDADNVLIALMYTTPSPKTSDTRIEITWKQQF